MTPEPINPVAPAPIFVTGRRRAWWWVAGALVVLAAVGSARYRWESWPTRAVLRGAGDDTWPLAFTSDSRTLATGGSDGITLWDIESGARRGRWDVPDGLRAFAGAYAPDGRTFAAALSAYPKPTTIALIDTATGRVRATLATGHVTVYDLAFADGGRSLRAFLGDIPRPDKQITTWDVTTGAETASRPVSPPTSFGTAVAPDGTALALWPHGGSSIRVWDTVAGAERVALTDPSAPAAFSGGVAFAPDGQTLFAGRDDGTIEVWVLATGRVRQRLAGHSGGYESWGIEVAPDGRSLASRGEYRRNRSFLETLLTLPNQILRGPSWSPAPEVIVVDLASGATLARAPAALHPHFSPDGRTIATRESDLSVHLRPNPAPPR